jgi:hypothetical protein
VGGTIHPKMGSGLPPLPGGTQYPELTICIHRAIPGRDSSYAPNQPSIRINQQWRICFVWTDAGPEDVEIVDYH